MKNLVVALVLVLASQAVHADEQLSQSQAGSTGSGYLQSVSSKKPVSLKPVAPQPTGVFVALYQRGWVVLSPLAPAKEGYGEHYLTEASIVTSTSQQSGINTKPNGGIKLFGWDF